ncbi:hypothetical protein D3C80_2026400 [compost metagenome]
MPAECFFQQVRGVASALTGTFKIVIQLIPVIRMRTIVDNQACTLTRRETAQIGEALFSDQNINIVLSMINMRHHRHD